MKALDRIVQLARRFLDRASRSKAAFSGSKPADTIRTTTEAGPRRLRPDPTRSADSPSVPPRR